MTQIAHLLAANQGYAAARANAADPRPSQHMAIVTCMDARIDVFAVLGLHLGEAHVIRNAGGRVTEEDIDLLVATPYLNPLNEIAGFIYDVESGELNDVVHWRRPS
jgi:carbonic anhydrase